MTFPPYSFSAERKAFKIKVLHCANFSKLRWRCRIQISSKTDKIHASAAVRQALKKKINPPYLLVKTEQRYFCRIDQSRRNSRFKKSAKQSVLMGMKNYQIRIMDLNVMLESICYVFRSDNFYCVWKILQTICEMPLQRFRGCGILG